MREFIGRDPPPEVLEEAHEAFVPDLMQHLLSPDSDAACRRMAALTSAPRPDRRLHTASDIRIACLLDAPGPNMAVAEFPGVGHALIDGAAGGCRGRTLAGVRALTLARWILAGGGTGFAPLAPGTIASAAAVVVGAALLLVSPWLVVLAGLLATLGGLLLLRRVRVEGDPGWVVIDEFAGQWLSLCALSRPSLIGLAAAFLIFRVLDIAKPGPVGWADRQQGAWGIMMDDVIGGVLAAIGLAAVRFSWPGAGL